MNEEPIRKRLLQGLTKLQLETRTYGRDTDDALVDYADALAPYGGHALKAIAAWPLEHAEWPTLKELVDLTKDCIAEHRAANAMSHVRGLDSPVGKFIDHVSKSRAAGPAYVTSWLNAEVNCAFSENAIFTTSYGAERLKRDWGRAARGYGVSIEPDPAQDERLAMHVDGLRAEGKLGRKRA